MLTTKNTSDFETDLSYICCTKSPLLWGGFRWGSPKPLKKLVHFVSQFPVSVSYSVSGIMRI